MSQHHDEPLMHQIKLYVSGSTRNDMSTILRHIKNNGLSFRSYSKEVKRFFVYRNLVFVLRDQGASDDRIKHAAYQAIAFFEGLINTIKHAAGIENQPDIPSSQYIPVSIPGQRPQHQEPAEVTSSNGNGNGHGHARKSQFEISNDLFG